jgi:hypothetical protein
MTGVMAWPPPLYCGLTDVRPDEPCFNLSELNLMAPDSRSVRRYQVLVLVRDDRLANVRIDLGPATSFAAPEFRVLGGVVDEVTKKIEILHTVGELRDIAEYQRHTPTWQPEVVRTDIVGRYHDQLDKNRRRRRTQSVIGPHLRVQRND